MEENLLDRESTHDTTVERTDFHQTSAHSTPDPENPFQSLGLPENTEIIPGLLATERELRSALANIQQYNALQGKTKMAHVFGLPLLSDALAHKVADLLIESQPQVVEADTADEKEEICWLDLFWEPELEPRRHNDETYYCSIKKGNALIELSAWQYDLVFTCRQLLRTQTYLCDLLTERKALDFMAKTLSSYEQLASESEVFWLHEPFQWLTKDLVVETGKATLLQITGKLQAVEENLSRLSWTPQVPDPASRHNSVHEDETMVGRSEIGRSEIADESAVEDVKEEGLSGIFNKLKRRC